MGERKKFRMTEEQHETLLEACQPVRYMVVGGVPPRSPQENANAAWAVLGRELSFDSLTVEPDGADNRDFTAESTGDEA